MASTTNRALGWTLVASLPLYVLAVHVMPIPSSPRAPVTILFVALGLISVGIAGGTLAYRRHALSGPIQRGEPDLATPKGQARAFQVFILNLVLSESAGIYGLVLAFRSGRAAYSIPFALAALALMVAQRPTAPDLTPSLNGGRFRPTPIA